MAISLISPGVKITEQDLVASNQSVASTAGAIAGQFNWGPIEFPTQVTSESDLVAQYGKPNTNTIVDFLSAANFLGYSSPLFVVRVANTALNATAEATTGSNTAGTGLSIKNDDVYLNTASFDNGPWIAKYAGALGNAIKVSACPSASAFSSALTGTFTVAVGGTTVTGSGSTANTQLQVGDLVVIGGRTNQVSAIANATSFTLSSAHLTGASAVSATRRWEYFGEFNSTPGTSTGAAALGASGDELHVAVIDRTGDITGVPGTILEKFESVSKASNAKGENGGSNYYKDVINDQSNWIRWTDHDASGTNWGTALLVAGAATTYTSVTTPKVYTLGLVSHSV
jgi:hypothetical protein